MNISCFTYLVEHYLSHVWDLQMALAYHPCYGVGLKVIWAPLHKTIVSLQLMVSLQTMVSTIDFLILIGYGAVLLW